MTQTIHNIHFTPDSKLKEYVENKLAKLPNYHDHITSVEVFLKLDNVVHQIKDKIAEIKLSIPKHQLFVKHESKSFEESFDHAFDSMLEQLKRTKEKLQSKH
jgi:putative sigma-54 modulation protein